MQVDDGVQFGRCVPDEFAGPGAGPALWKRLVRGTGEVGAPLRGRVTLSCGSPSGCGAEVVRAAGSTQTAKRTTASRLLAR